MLRALVYTNKKIKIVRYDTVDIFTEKIMGFWYGNKNNKNINEVNVRGK